MKIERIGFMTPGDMGQGVAMQLRKKGFTVFTALEKRSERSRRLAAEAGLVDLGSIAKLTAESDLIMSVMNPGAALEFAREAAETIRAQTRKPVFIDCNAVAPDTMREIEAAMQAAGARCLDGGLIGPPPRGKAKVNLYVSGAGAGDMAQLENEQLRVHVMSEKLGDASAVKMCYSAFNKGTQGVLLETLMAARRLGVYEELEKQLLSSRADAYNALLNALPLLPPKAYRWVPEMHEIACTFAGVGMTPRIFQGEADMFELVAETPLGRETPENRDPARTGKDVIQQLADSPRK
jgi:3-hydroxyisobutyrate dehydrogenase-like beta-hydroxyacid dehydrogenase